MTFCLHGDSEGGGGGECLLVSAGGCLRVRAGFLLCLLQGGDVGMWGCGDVLSGGKTGAVKLAFGGGD